MDHDALDPSYAPTRTALHRVATHVLARARHGEAGRFGLRALPGGFGTPQFGAQETVLRVSGRWLVHEWRAPDGARTSVAALDGASLRSLAAFIGVELTPGFSVGHDTPDLGDPDEPLAVDAAAVQTLAHWLALGAAAVDRAVGGLGAAGRPTVLQLWPEHFDAGLDVATPSGRVNLGMSTGDGFCEEPYAYVGPWNPDRPGDAAYWNAPFGAVVRASELPDEAGARLDGFFREGLARMGATL